LKIVRLVFSSSLLFLLLARVPAAGFEETWVVLSSGAAANWDVLTTFRVLSSPPVGTPRSARRETQRG
jgi:hypothetical protein